MSKGKTRRAILNVFFCISLAIGLYLTASFVDVSLNNTRGANYQPWNAFILLMEVVQK